MVDLRAQLQTAVNQTCYWYSRAIEYEEEEVCQLDDADQVVYLAWEDTCLNVPPYSQTSTEHMPRTL